jgi:acylphosphatase
MPCTRRITVSGRVQGVWFRAWTVETAQSLGLSGWVRNCRDGSLEALVSGDDEAVAQMIEACRQGPPSAVVESLNEQPADEPAETGFKTRPTA